MSSSRISDNQFSENLCRVDQVGHPGYSVFFHPDPTVSRPGLWDFLSSFFPALTDKGLIEISIVFEVVVTVIVVRLFAEGPALGVRYPVLIQRLLQVQNGCLRVLLCVVTYTELEILLERESEKAQPALSSRKAKRDRFSISSY